MKRRERVAREAAVGFAVGVERFIRARGMEPGPIPLDLVRNLEGEYAAVLDRLYPPRKRRQRKAR